MYWQIYVTTVSFGDQGRVNEIDPKTCVLWLWPITTCALASLWQSEMVRHRKCWKYSNKCYHFTATKTSVTVSAMHHEHDRVTRCTFSVDFKEIKTTSQSLPNTCVTCLQPQQGGRHRGEIETSWLSGTVNFRIRIKRYFLARCLAYHTGTYEMTRTSTQS